jgi:hypothetical protein
MINIVQINKMKKEVLDKKKLIHKTLQTNEQTNNGGKLRYPGRVAVPYPLVAILLLLKIL